MDKRPSIQRLAFELYSFLASRFPVCCSSDEFVFFPQAVQEDLDWSVWDDLSPASVEEAVIYLQGFRGRIAMAHGPGKKIETPLVSLLMWATSNLEEQFMLVKSHATQPTFPLTVATVGLIQALQSGEQHAWIQRLETLPAFLEKARSSLSNVAELYRDLGVEMARGIVRWLNTMEPSAQIAQAVEALGSYTQRLSVLCPTKDFRLEPDLLERIVKIHTGSGLTVKEVLRELEDEVSLTRQLLMEEAQKLGAGGDWEAAYSSIAGDKVPGDGKKALLSAEISRLRDHCLHLGFLDALPGSGDNITIEPLPTSLITIRSADSYNAMPGHPFQGGVFYIFGGGSLGIDSRSIHPVYRMTAAHEAYPGHHLLDLLRWSNPEAALRPMEYPLFYEGWACYGEDLMLGTGAFDRPSDRLIILRRRFRHAVRGKVDLLLHSGDMGFDSAAMELVTAGFPRNRALQTVRKYALRPAYQMCYTIGRRRFQRLFDSYGQGNIPGFVNTVLTGGELLFDDLERVLKQGAGRRAKGEDGKPVSV